MMRRVTGPLHVVFAADARVLPGLHVTAHSVLAHHAAEDSPIHFHVLSEVLGESDEHLLRATLATTGRPFDLTFHRIDGEQFLGFPSLKGSWATYFRLLAPHLVEAERLLYLDVDLVCCCDVSELLRVDLQGRPVAGVAETSIRLSPDQTVARALPEGSDGLYLSAGVLVIDVAAWRRQRVTERAIEHLRSHPVRFYDQSALNVVLYSNWLPLDSRFNYPPNYRCYWPALRRGDVQGKILHFMASPKPWNFLAEFLHPHHRIWGGVLRQTALSQYRSWHATPARQMPTTLASLGNYRRTVIDRILYAAGGVLPAPAARNDAPLP